MSDVMNAGRELDALVAERVMGWTRQAHRDADASGVHQKAIVPPGTPDMAVTDLFFADDVPIAGLVPPYSTSIAEAWKVIEKLTEGELRVSVDYSGRVPEFQWFAAVYHFREGRSHIRVIKAEIGAPTAPLAICRAALKAVEVTHA